MEELKEYIAQELPFIERVLSREMEELDPFVRPIAEHIMSAGGKRFRPVLCILTARCLGFRKDSIYPLATALEFLHSATLLHDDILDSAVLRRGRPAAHMVYGNKTTVLAGDAMLALANKLVAGYGIPELMQTVSEAIVQTATGEILEVAQSKDGSFTLDGYFRMITGKTAYLLRAATECASILACSSPEITRAAADYGHNLGIAFQLIDDALDYTANEKMTGKPNGGDLREGKYTLPLLFYLGDLERDEADVLKKRIRTLELTEDELAAIVRDVRERGYGIRTREVADSYLESAATALQKLPAAEERDLLFTALDYVRNREK
ncbi:MAG: polyprenyl synthetase family protein [Desulfovibrionales bacterium]